MKPLHAIRFVCLIAFTSFLASCSQEQSSNDTPAASKIDGLVKTQDEFNTAVSNAKPGDTIVLANGVWTDFEMLFEAQGTEAEPITLTAETKGEVIISGQSNLRLAGEYLLVSGLVFKDGYTPTEAVISFRKNSETLANHSRVTEVVIDRFNNPERRETDYWVALYGKHNRFDHNHLVGKGNKGVTVAVRLNNEASRENHHKIDHNYFGPRDVFGSNGGETLRIGTSHYSLSNSYTVVENNYFDRCDGEVEIISNKSGSNEFRGNVFFESRGTLTLRHGNGNLVENNVFFGNGVDHTGGIRVINADQTIRNNYMEGLTGYRFGGAFVVMNGVPNSPINRYHQVANALIENNSLINSDHIQMAAGSDQERSAKPVDSTFKNNLIYSDTATEIFTIYDDMSGVSFENNLQSPLDTFAKSQSFVSEPFTLSRAENGLLYPVEEGAADFGVSETLTPIAKNDTGVAWYPKPDKASRFEGGKQIAVDVEDGGLAKAVAAANAGDVLVLASGKHVASRVLILDKPLSVVSADEANPALITFERSALFEIRDGGSLSMSNVSISGEDAPDGSGNSVFRTQLMSMLSNYDLLLDNVSIYDLDVNHSFNVLSAAKSTMADRIQIKNSSIKDVTGHVLKLDAENDDFGIYNAEYVDITGSSFDNVQGAIALVYRGGTDESTFGPHFTFVDNKVSEVGSGKRNKSKAAYLLHGVQVTNIHSNHISDSKPISVVHTVAEPKTRVTDNTFIRTTSPTVVELNSGLENTAVITGNKYQD